MASVSMKPTRSLMLSKQAESWALNAPPDTVRFATFTMTVNLAVTCLGLCLFIPRTHLGECGHSPVRAIFVSNQLPREGLPVLLALTMLTAAEVQLGGHLYWSPVCRPAATLFVAVCQHLTIPAMPEAYNSTVSSGGLRTIQATQYTRPHNSSLRPNVFVIIHESLGRKFMFDRSPIPGAQNNTLTRAEAAMPFFHERFRRDPHVYDFAFARTVSGNTENAMPALMSGRLIIGPQQSLSSRDDGLRDIPHLGAMARAAGYSPVIYCSYPSRYTSRWQRLNQFLHDAFDHVYDVDMLHAPRINEQGMDDRNLTSLLEDHFRRGYYDDGAGGEGRPPFFIVMVYNNQHVPFLVPSKEEIIQSHGSRVMPPNLTAGVARSKEAQEAESRLAWLLAAVEDHSNQARYMLSLSITDEMLRQVYELFHARQLLNSTIITLNSDHGEGPQPMLRSRASAISTPLKSSIRGGTVQLRRQFFTTPTAPSQNGQVIILLVWFKHKACSHECRRKRQRSFARVRVSLANRPAMTYKRISNK